MAHSANTAISHASRSSGSVSLGAKLTSFFALARQRRQLAALEPHLLNDIGVTQAQARSEGRKTGWDVPQHWHY